MLFYAKKDLRLELAVAIVLVGAGWIGIHALAVPVGIDVTVAGLAAGIAGAVALAIWTLLIQSGYALVRGYSYASGLTRALAKHFAKAQPSQVCAALFAAAGEEVFFRGLIQGTCGVLAGAVAFMLAHIGGRDIRIIGYWSIFQGLGLGILYVWTGNLLCAIVAHGLFDVGAMTYFRVFMTRRPATS